MARQLAFEGFVSLSHEVMPRIGEYERGMATFLNAYVGPVMQRYLVALQQKITHTMPKASLSVLQSHGQRIGAEQAANQAVRLLLSGPAGGLHGAKAIGNRHGYTRLITLDMGGTSTDIAVIDGDIAVSEEGQIDTYPVHVPMVDMHTIGAGGGSIAFLDQAGVLQVGPASAGANPGPACYGLGGTSPTVTDAHVVLGTLPKHLKLGGSRSLNPGAAMQVYQKLAAQMGVGVTTAAQGVIAVTSENMAQAARLMSVDHGHDPRQGFALMCFGGAGGLHACDVAEKLGCSTVLIPAQAGVLSAMGMLCAPFGRRQQTMLLQPLSSITAAQLQQKAQSLSNDIAQQLQQDQPGATIQFKTTLQVRYRGQGHALAVAGIDLENLRAAFEDLHQKRYGFTLDREIEIESLIQEGFCAMPQWRWPKWKQPVDRVPEKSVMVGGTRAVCWERSQLTPESRFTGPAVVTDPIGTTWISKNWQAQMADDGTLILSRQ